LPDAHLDLVKSSMPIFSGAGAAAAPPALPQAQEPRAVVVPDSFFVCHRFDPLYCLVYPRAGSALRFPKLCAAATVPNAIRPTRRPKLGPAARAASRPSPCCPAKPDARARYYAQQFRRRPKNCGFALRVGFGIAECPGLLRGQVFVGAAIALQSLQASAQIQFLETIKRFPDRFTRDFATASSCARTAGFRDFPLKFFSTIAAVRLARFPRPFARCCCSE